MVRLLSILVMVVVLGHGAACNPRYCAGNPDDDCRKSWDAGPMVCKGNGDCMAPLGVCDLETSMACVQCTPSQAAACVGATPACVTNQCQKCTAHSQCSSSNVCLPDGSCADASNVAYVQAGGTGASPCDKAAPCGTLDDGVKAGRPTVKVAAGTVMDNKVTSIDGAARVIVADPGAKITRSNQGVILEVKNDGADVAIYDLEITGGAGAGNAAISVPNGGTPKLSLTRVAVDGNQGAGISVAAGSLSIARSTIGSNTGGGISISGAQFDITNTFIVSNGGASTPFGGVSIAQTGNGVRRFEFNTVSNNVGADGAALGVVCSLITQPIVLSNNIVYANQTGGTRTQVGGGMCSWSYSDVGPDTVAGTGNTGADAMFVDPTKGNFHIRATSPARDAADPAATLAIDFDGNARPQGTRSDMGADEVTP